MIVDQPVVRVEVVVAVQCCRVAFPRSVGAVEEDAVVVVVERAVVVVVVAVPLDHHRVRCVVEVVVAVVVRLRARCVAVVVVACHPLVRCHVVVVVVPAAVVADPPAVNFALLLALRLLVAQVRCSLLASRPGSSRTLARQSCSFKSGSFPRQTPVAWSSSSTSTVAMDPTMTMRKTTTSLCCTCC